MQVPWLQAGACGAQQYPADMVAAARQDRRAAAGYRLPAAGSMMQHWLQHTRRTPAGLRLPTGLSDRLPSSDSFSSSDSGSDSEGSSMAPSSGSSSLSPAENFISRA